MSCKPNIRCNDEERKAALVPYGPPHNGIESVEVVAKPDGDPLVHRVLAVFFFGAIPPGLDNAHLDRFTFEGGVRVLGKDIRVKNAQAEVGSLQLTLDRGGDWSDYTLNIKHPDLDPLYSCRGFNFMVDCPNPFDCKRPAPNPPPLPPAPPIDYQVRDYRSFRRALLDFLTVRVPQAREGNEADLAVTLAELFAYAGDRLSYYQDAVANEAYLATARQRRSAKRHAALVDYRMHDGLGARTVLHMTAAEDVTVPKGWPVKTRNAVDERRIQFETDADVVCRSASNEIPIHTWRNALCCLPKGSTSAELVAKLEDLKTVDLLLFEEQLGVVEVTKQLLKTAADPTKRQIVRLKKVERIDDPLETDEVLRVTWDEADALRFDFCLESDASGKQATAARANLVRATHGKKVAEVLVKSLELSESPLRWLDPSVDLPLYPPDEPNPRRGVSSVELTVNGDLWEEQGSLLDSLPYDAHFVVETDNQGRGMIRVGDGAMGRALPKNAVVTVVYRVGNGSAGNVGADALTEMPSFITGITVRNPLPAAGGIDPESIIEVRRDAPQEFAAVPYRAVTADDYARAAEGVPNVSNAAAQFRWTGSWSTVFVAVDPVRRIGMTDKTRAAVKAKLESYRQAGYDVDIQDPIYVPLSIQLEICVLPDHFQGDVREALVDTLSSGYRLDGGLGFFHPDNFTFGQSLYLSRLIEAVQTVPGVLAARAELFQRLNRPSYGEIDSGVLPVGPFEIVRLDNDPSVPDNGMLVLEMRGGK